MSKEVCVKAHIWTAARFDEELEKFQSQSKRLIFMKPAEDAQGNPLFTKELHLVGLFKHNGK